VADRGHFGRLALHKHNGPNGGLVPILLKSSARGVCSQYLVAPDFAGERIIHFAAIIESLLPKNGPQLLVREFFNAICHQRTFAQDFPTG
jgi:hypothetical protein